MEDEAKSSHFRNQRQIVERLLIDRKNACKSGLQDMILIDTKTGYDGGGLIINEEALRRAFSAGSEARSHRLLTVALSRLCHERSASYVALCEVYHADASDREMDRVKESAHRFGGKYRDRYRRANLGINWLTVYLLDDDLYARFPSRMSGKEHKTIEEWHEEIYRVYLEHRRRNPGRGKTAAVKNTVVDYEGSTGVSESTVWRVLGARGAAGK